MKLKVSAQIHQYFWQALSAKANADVLITKFKHLGRQGHYTHGGY